LKQASEGEEQSLMDFQPAGDDHGDDDLEYLDFGDPVVTQKPRSPPKFPQYVPKFRGGFGLPEKKQQITSSINEASDGNIISKRRQRKKRGAAQLPVSDGMAKDNFRVACTRGNEEELKSHLVNGKFVHVFCVCVLLNMLCTCHVM